MILWVFVKLIPVPWLMEEARILAINSLPSLTFDTPSKERKIERVGEIEATLLECSERESEGCVEIVERNTKSNVVFCNILSEK